MATTTSPLTDLQFNIHFRKVEAMALNSSCFLSLPSYVRRNHRVPLRICLPLLHSSAIRRRRSLRNCLLALLRHSITFWIYLPLQMIAEEFAVDRSQLPVFDISNSGSYGEVLGQITSQNQKLKDGYATADAPISLQRVEHKFTVKLQI
ncbi:uncharacterized protein LOC111791696 [Cucurbita pepo subsp. pepo]|uniref:uncharacterized protein LOC111791696 n=1 Tax=Cucurbita pepo subsp. pepo TaxID=3664 RepID=UPI000C9D322F|nr:uncharacterized protein LOC111791696 [Cucurbita pepo subsp. pepo]